LRYFHPTEFATVCLLELDLARNVVRIANAGHLPPLLVESTKSSYLQVQRPMLGLRRQRPPETTVALAPSWEMVLVTDGLVEHRPSNLDRGMEQLRTAVSFEMAPEQLCDALIDRFGQDKSDDVALLVLRRR